MLRATVSRVLVGSAVALAASITPPCLAQMDPAQSGPPQTSPAQSGPAQTGPAQSGPAQSDAAQSDAAQMVAPSTPPPLTTTPDQARDAAHEDDDDGLVRDVERYRRFRELLIERQRSEERLFAETVARYTKLRELTEKIQAEHQRAIELEFNADVELFLRKRAFTQELMRARREGTSNAVSLPSLPSRPEQAEPEPAGPAGAAPEPFDSTTSGRNPD